MKRKERTMKTETKTQHTPGPLSFDGFGINGGDIYKSRLATFTPISGNFKDAEYYGPLFAAAPELLELLNSMLKAGVFKGVWIELVCEAIEKAEGK